MENVIVGRLIRVGTGMPAYRDIYRTPLLLGITKARFITFSFSSIKRKRSTCSSTGKSLSPTRVTLTERSI